MRRRQLKWLWTRLKKLAAMDVSREERLMKLGAARSKAPSAWRLVDGALDEKIGALSFSLNRHKLRTVRRRERRYLLRTNLAESDPAELWQYYIQLVAVEEAFKNPKGDLAIRPSSTATRGLQLVLAGPAEAAQLELPGVATISSDESFMTS